MALLGFYDGILKELLSACEIARNADQPLLQTAEDSPLLKFCLEETNESSCQLIIQRAESAHQVDAVSALCWTSPHHQVAMRVSRQIEDLTMDSGNQQTQLILYDLCRFAFKYLKEPQKPDLKILTNEKLIMSLFDFKRQPDHQRVENFLVSAYLFMHLIRVPGDRLMTVFEDANSSLCIQIGDGPRSSIRKLTFDCSTETDESFEQQFLKTLSEGGSPLYICLFFNELKTCSWYLNEKGKDKQHDRLPNHDTSLIKLEGDGSKLNISVTAFDSVEDKYSSFQMELSADAAFSPDRFGDDKLLSTVVRLVRKVVVEQKPANLCLVCLTVPCRTAIKWLDIASGRETSCCTEEGQTVPSFEDAQLSIFHSAASGDVALLRQRLEYNRLLVSARQQEFPHRTALLCAAAAAPEYFSQGQQSHTECASLLINKGADVGDCDSRGHSVLHCAVLSDNEKLVEFLLKNSTADPNSRDEDGLTPLQLAVEQENVAMADLFLESGVDVCLNPDGTIVELVQALDSENFELVRTLLNHCPEAMSDDQFYKYYWQAWKLDATQICSLLLISKYGLSNEAVQEAAQLGQFASQGDVEQLKSRLSVYNCNLRDWDCRTPLMWAAIASCDPTEGHADCAQLLLSLRGNPSAADLDGNSSLHLAAASNNIEVAALLLLHGADVKVKNRKGAFPAELAKQSGQLDVQLIMETAEELERRHGAVTVGKSTEIRADLQIRPRQTWSTLFYKENIRMAGSNGHLKVVKFLVTQVADQANRDRCCIYAAESAATNGQLEVVKFLVSTVSDQTKRDRCCIYAAESAATNGQLEVVKFLVSTVADQTKRDDYCITAAESAASNGQLEVVKFLVPTVTDETKRDYFCIKAAESAVVWGQWEVVKFLVPTVADEKKRDYFCIKAAESAAIKGHFEVVKFLAHKVTDQTKRDDCCIKAAESAATNGQLEVVKFLVSTVADQTKRDDYCIKAAESAAIWDRWDVVKFLVPIVTDKTKRDDCCVKAAESAAIKGHFEVVKFLLHTIADQKKRNDCCIKAAESAATNGQLEIVKFLVHTVADQTERDDCCVKAAESAAIKGHFEVVKFLADTVSDQAKRDDCCIKAAESAATNGQLEIVKFLVHTVADQTKRDDCCVKVAESAAIKGHFEVVKFLADTVSDQAKRDDCCIKAAESAATNGQLEVVKFLADTVSDQTKRDDFWIKPAKAAATNGQLKVVNFLVSTVADQTVRDDCRIKAAESAATNGQLEIVKFLVHTVADQTERDDCCVKAAESAAIKGHFEVVKLLADTVSDQAKIDDCCIKAAESAATNGQLEIVKFLVHTVADQTKRDDCCVKVAESAAIKGHFEVVKFLADTVSDQAKRDDCCIKAAESAATNGQLEIVKFLADTVSDQTKRDDFWIKPAKAAATNGQLKVVNFLVSTVADQTVRDDYCIKAAESAVVWGQLEIVKFLVHTVADQTKRDDCCVKAAESAAIKGHFEVVKFLLHTIADQKKRNDCCIKAAESAATNGQLEIVKFLVHTVADQTERDDCCVKAAESAAIKGHFEVVKFLADTVSDQAKRDDCCVKAAESAAIKGHFEVVKFLADTVSDQAKRDDCCIKAAESAATNGQLEIVKFLVHTVADQTKRDDCCVKVAESAAIEGHFEVLKFLVLKVTDKTKRDDYCIKAAESAVVWGQLEIVKFLVHTVADQTKRDDCCVKAAESAAIKGHFEVVKLLADTVSDQAKRDDCCIKAAESAVVWGQLEIVKFLVPTVADETKRDDYCIKAAESAAIKGHFEVVKFLLHTIADQKKRNDCCIKAAESAATNGQLEIVKFLVHTVADQAKRDDCCIKAAESAATNGQLEIVKFLADTVSDQTKRDDFWIKRAKDAARNGQLKVVKFLVSTVADQTVRDDYCIKAAESAVVWGQWEVVKFLVPTVADETKRDYFCIKAAESAAIKGHFEVVKFLLHTIADQKKRNDCCIKAAESAATNGQLEIVKFLVHTVADQTERDDCCVKAAESAAIKGHFEVVKILADTVSDQAKRDDCCIKAAESAATNGQLEIVKFLVHIVADQAKRDDCCVKAAESAAIKGHFEVVKFLADTVSDQAKRDDCCISAIESAVIWGQWEVAEFLIPCLSSPNQKANLRFQCAVVACSHLREDFVAALGLEPDWLFQSSTILSFTAAMAIEGRNSVLTDTLSRMQPAHITQLLCLSISQRHVALAVTLIYDERVSTEHIDLPDSTGATALMLAADAGHHELIEKLIDLGASVRAKDSQGRTALSRACEAGHVRAAKALLDRGADASHRDGRGLTCAQVAQRYEQRQVLRLLNPSEVRSSKAEQAAAHCLDSGLHRLSDDSQKDRRLSEELHRLLSEAGFTRERADCQQRLADWLERVARVLTQDDRQMTGSYAEGWANSLVQVNGRTAADSDIDWTVLVSGKLFHLEGSCIRLNKSCRDATRLQVTEGHAQVAVEAGGQPAVTATACGVRPAQDTCHATRCCRSFCEDRIEKLLLYSDSVHLVRATRPSSTNELRVSFSFQEKRIMRELSTIQGQLFTLIKFIFKRYLPLTLDTPGLKTYHAKTLLFTMLEKYDTDPKTVVWQPHNLIALLKESLNMMLSFIDSSSSPDECMPHFFMPDAPLYFKYAGIGGDFDNTKARVRDQLCELRSDIGGVVKQLRRLVRPPQSEKFYFHPFTLLPLTAPPAVTEIRKGRGSQQLYCKFADVYSLVHQCVSELQSESSDRDTLMKHLSLLHEQQWCKCAALCMTAMAHLKFGESEEAERLAMELQRHQIESGLKPQDIREESWWNITRTKLPEDSDWAWRFCLPCDSSPHFPFLPEFTQSLFTARLSQPLASHLYVNFRCLSWSLQAELLRNRAPAIAFDHWIEQLLEDPDLEELLTLAHYSDCCEHVELSLQQMEMIKKERRVAIETQDEEKISWVRQKLERLNDAVAEVHRSEKEG
ncbi:hypothetical protein BOX15_Mlig012511g1 [Macrostomum lignano]|uniref:Uncharacterized protein n=1 Tax=Macrostomum lignano TaxID=282301 RepID=A0A267E988_9PLAT|nr:hypothetical protein BOX15_Mlig012511g1 [Macrostomum lignano]